MIHVSKLEVHVGTLKISGKHLKNKHQPNWVSVVLYTMHGSSWTWLLFNNPAKKLIAVGHIPKNHAIHGLHRKHRRMKNTFELNVAKERRWALFATVKKCGATLKTPLVDPNGPYYCFIFEMCLQLSTKFVPTKCGRVPAKQSQTTHTLTHHARNHI